MTEDPFREDTIELADAIVQTWEQSPLNFTVTYQHQLQMAQIAARQLVEIANSTDH